MQTLVLALDPHAIDSACITRAAEVLRQGGLVAFPTETVYGLGAHALDPVAAARIFTAKGRPVSNPVIVHVADSNQVPQVAADWPPPAARLAQHFWPGPLTLVLPRRPEVPAIITAGGSTVAVRVPAHPIAQALLRAAGVPVAAPSANRSCELSPTQAEHVLRGLEGRIDILLDGGPTPGGIESTVLDVTRSPARLLRPGLVSPGELEAIIGPIERMTLLKEPTAVLPSPGMMLRHYAPRTPLECVEAGGPERARALAQTGLRVGWLTFLETPSPEHDNVVVRRLPADVAPYSAQLYAVLHQLDTLGLDRIIADLPPDTPEWLAVRDRLRRAASRPQK